MVKTRRMKPVEMRPFTYTPPHAPYFSVVHIDDLVLVLDKPSGLLTVSGKAPEHSDCLETRVQAAFPEARIVHRLDMDTSGLCVMARTTAAHRNLSLQFQRRKTVKTYIAWVWGRPQTNEGMVDLPLICDWPNRPKQMVDHERGRSAQTRWEVLAWERQVTRLRLVPITGRSHQLRVHTLSLGCPILGDRFYAHDEAWAAAGRLQLHAEELSFHHPADGTRVTFRSPSPLQESVSG